MVWPKAQTSGQDASTQAGQQARLGLSDALLWLVVAQFGSVFWFLGVTSVMDSSTAPEDLPISTRAVLQLAFVFAYGVGPVVWAFTRGSGPLRELGTDFQPRDVPIGLLAGVVTQLVVLPVLYFPILRFVDADPSEAAEALTSLVGGNLDRILLSLMVVVAAPLAEEIFFRGLLLRALRRHMNAWWAVTVQALVFAAVHFQSLQFAGLFVFGLIAGGLAVHFNRLGPSWATHVAFNAVTLAILL